MTGRYTDRSATPVSPRRVTMPCTPALYPLSRLLKRHLPSLPGRLQGLGLWGERHAAGAQRLPGFGGGRPETHGGFETLGGPAGQSGGPSAGPECLAGRPRAGSVAVWLEVDPERPEGPIRRHSSHIVTLDWNNTPDGPLCCGNRLGNPSSLDYICCATRQGLTGVGDRQCTGRPCLRIPLLKIAYMYK